MYVNQQITGNNGNNHNINNMSMQVLNTENSNFPIPYNNISNNIIKSDGGFQYNKALNNNLDNAINTESGQNNGHTSINNILQKKNQLSRTQSFMSETANEPGNDQNDLDEQQQQNYISKINQEQEIKRKKNLDEQLNEKLKQVLATDQKYNSIPSIESTSSQSSNITHVSNSQQQQQSKNYPSYSPKSELSRKNSTDLNLNEYRNRQLNQQSYSTQINNIEQENNQLMQDGLQNIDLETILLQQQALINSSNSSSNADLNNQRFIENNLITPEKLNYLSNHLNDIFLRFIIIKIL